MATRNAALSCIAMVLVAWIVLSTSIAQPTLALTTDQQQVIQLTIAAVQAKNPSAPSPVVTKLSIASGYALTTWLWGDAGGQALLSKSSKRWSVVQAHGGRMDATILHAFGVPSTTAATLIASLAPAPK